MRKIIFPLMLLVAGCSAPRYYGYFGGQSYRFPVTAVDPTRRQPESERIVAMASTADEEGQLRQIAALAPAAFSPVQAPRGITRKVSRREVTESKRFTFYSSPAFSSLDDDLKMAIILGAAGLTGLFLVILSQIFGILGGLLLIGGVIYFTRWMLRQ